MYIIINVININVLIYEALYEDDPINYPKSENEKLSPKEFAMLALILYEGNTDFTKIVEIFYIISFVQSSIIENRGDNV